MKLPRSNIFLFLRQFISDPASVGAALPSSSYLAKAMAEQIPASKQGWVIELGPGTGVITHALLERGINMEKLIVVEQSPLLAAHLRKTFPKLTVIEGDAKKLDSLLSPAQRTNISAIVSSLPLRAMSLEDVDIVLQKVASLLQEDSLFIQFTYDLRSKNSRVFELGKKWLNFCSSSIVWLNVPPACVYVFSKLF